MNHNEIDLELVDRSTIYDQDGNWPDYA
jgi:hypothetical protein